MGKFSRKTLETAKGLRLIDDALFRLVGANTEVCEEILRTLLDDEELIVLQATPQETMTSLHREITLDVLCRLADGKIIDIEVQKGEENDDIRRCRFHLSSITANKTPTGTDFKDVPDVIIIYITEYDALGNGKAVTCSEMYQELNGRYIPLNDGAKVYYANTVVNDNTDKSELLELFLKKDSFDSKKFPKLSRAMKYFKEDEKGVGKVCNLVEVYAKEFAKEYALKFEDSQKEKKDQAEGFARYLIQEGKDVTEIAFVTHLTEEEVKELSKSVD